MSRTKPTFEDILNDCLERLGQGESLEACLRRYPAEAPELAPLLRLALETVTLSSSIVVPTRVQQAVWVRLAQAWQGQPRKVRQPFFTPHLLLRPLPAAIMLVLALFLAGWGTTEVAASSLPGDLLYPVKMARERVEVTLSASKENKARRYVKQAQERSREMEMLTRRKTDEASLTTLAQGSTQKASQAVRLMMEKTPPAVVLLPPPGKVEPSWRDHEKTRLEIRALLLEHLKHQAVMKQRWLEQLPPGQRKKMESVFEQEYRQLQRLIKELEKEAKQPERLPLEQSPIDLDQPGRL
ncbi:MAG: hypothetical protein HYY31_06620 [Chloroflexi bacterium]|nr:hypothetical protein [Chloroflexota bacterium]